MMPINLMKRISKARAIKPVIEFGKFLLRIDLDSLRIERSRELRWVHPVANSRYLFSCERNNIVVFIISKEDVEVVEIATCSTHNYDFLLTHRFLHSRSWVVSASSNL